MGICSLNITILYESLCPDSVDFFMEQLQPAWSSLAPYTNFTYVPFGKAYSIKNGKRFICQHGANECAGNKMQSCVLHLLRGQPFRQFTFIICQMNGISPVDGSACFKKVNLNEWKVRQCENSDIGNSLQLLAENITHRFNPEFIPTILFNDLYFRSFQNMALMDFKHAACKFFPPGHVACI
ncbi:GILT-like protein 1 [Ctenocephalides felis]|uniref:GILT-like protein 1 n=1 Tax=Ctenocephalides felis TaxID=7515 RepID=UPI000E6E4B26|nr:GILT-like protein 1 [Ctenocephalides felis]